MIINDDSTFHSKNHKDRFAFITLGRYNSERFYEIIINTVEKKHSTGELHQFEAYQRIKPPQIDKKKASTVNVQFGIGHRTSIGSISIEINGI